MADGANGGKCMDFPIKTFACLHLATFKLGGHPIGDPLRAPPPTTLGPPGNSPPAEWEAGDEVLKLGGRNFLLCCFSLKRIVATVWQRAIESRGAGENDLRVGGELAARAPLPPRPCTPPERSPRPLAGHFRRWPANRRAASPANLIKQEREAGLMRSARVCFRGWCAARAWREAQARVSKYLRAPAAAEAALFVAPFISRFI